MLLNIFGNGWLCINIYCNNDVKFFIYDNDKDLVLINEVLRWCGGWWYNEGLWGMI